MAQMFMEAMQDNESIVIRVSFNHLTFNQGSISRWVPLIRIITLLCIKLFVYCGHKDGENSHLLALFQRLKPFSGFDVLQQCSLVYFCV